MAYDQLIPQLTDGSALARGNAVYNTGSVHNPDIRHNDVGQGDVEGFGDSQCVAAGIGH